MILKDFHCIYQIMTHCLSTKIDFSIALLVWVHVIFSFQFLFHCVWFFSFVVLSCCFLELTKFTPVNFSRFSTLQGGWFKPPFNQHVRTSHSTHCVHASVTLQHNITLTLPNHEKVTKFGTRIPNPNAKARNSRKGRLLAALALGLGILDSEPTLTLAYACWI